MQLLISTMRQTFQPSVWEKLWRTTTHSEMNTRYLWNARPHHPHTAQPVISSVCSDWAMQPTLGRWKDPDNTRTHYLLQMSHVFMKPHMKDHACFPSLQGRRQCSAHQFWYLGTSLVDILASWHQLLLVSWHQLGHLGTSLADILASWHQLSCLAAFLVILGAKISIFWWLWHHANIAFV